MKKQLERGQLEVETLKHFLNGGFGTITITNTRTGKHVTLRFAEPKPKNGQERDPFAPIFVKLFTGSSDEIKLARAYSYFGCIWRKDSRTGQPKTPVFWYDARKTKGGIERGDACVATVEWLLRVASGSQGKATHMELWHEGLCCFCGRPLTQTESIKRGYGPKCADSRNLPYGKQTKRAKKSEDVVPARKGDETYDERVADLLSYGFSVPAAESIAEGEAVQERERAEDERVAREKHERDLRLVEEEKPVEQEVTACVDDLDGFTWV